MRSLDEAIVVGAPRGKAARAGVGTSRLTLVITTLAGGGAERVLSTLSNYWAGQGREVTLITLDAAAHDSFPLHGGIRRVALELISSSRHLGEAIRSNGRRLWALRRAIRASRPDVVISFTDMTNVLVLLATRGLSLPVIVSERVDPSRHPLPWIWNGMRRVLYPWADALVVQTESVRRWAERFVPAAAIHTISNPAASGSTEPASTSDNELTARLPGGGSALVAAMGRLDSQKGFDLLLRSFACCLPDQPAWRLVILGEGPERGRLEALVTELGIADSVWLPGWVAEPERVLRQADLFVMSSRYEGFPNALLESMACGIPVISTDCPSGPAEIVRDGVDGVLVPPENVDALAAAMHRLMGDPAERRRLGSRATEVRERFALETVMKRWEQLLAEVVATRRSA